MHLVFDVIHADKLLVNLSATALTRGDTHASMDESLRAVFAEIGIELIEYSFATRLRVGDRVLIEVA